jgi:hypothetical protein
MDICNLYSLPNNITKTKSSRMRWTKYVVLMEGKKNAYMILTGKPEGNRLLGRRRYGWKDNIKRNLREIGWGIMQ